MKQAATFLLRMRMRRLHSNMVLSDSPVKNDSLCRAVIIIKHLGRDFPKHPSDLGAQGPDLTPKSHRHI